MTDSDTFAFGKFVPGFDFLRQLAQSGSGASAAAPLPGLGIVPTINVDELDKRIRELKAVQFWLEQNGAAVKATIQALEVQKMTLAALAGMNLNVAQMAEAFTATAPKPAPAPLDAPAAPAAAIKPGASSKDSKPAQAASEQAAASAGLVDPLQWWGALTQQFQQIAAETMREATRAAPARQTRRGDTGAGGTSAKKMAAKKTAVKKMAAKKAPARKAAAKKSATPKVANPPGWQLPTPFKLPG
ncbi:MAG: hypothetical protein LBI48_09100 [Burkholderiaceae bacterium]|jgi:hypothetical protein|nr:hypothetical protein [Burkholderiaceae bacterium]